VTKYIPGTILTTIAAIRREIFPRRRRLARKLPWARMTAGQRQTVARLVLPHKDRPHA